MQTSCKDTNMDFFEDKPSCKKAQILFISGPNLAVFQSKRAVYASSQSCLHCQECLSTSRVARRRNLYPTISVVHYGFCLSRHPGIEWPLIVLFKFKHIYV